MDYRLLDAFRQLFEGTKYLHRRSNLGDQVALHFYEDLKAIDRSKSLTKRIDAGEVVVNVKNIRQGVKARRGDGSLGEILPHKEPIYDDGFEVARGPIAAVEIGVEVKIVAKAMIKQIDRVVNDLKNQVQEFGAGGENCISVGIAGVNYAPRYTSYEGEREYPTDGGKYKHPIQEADEAGSRLMAKAKPAFDEFLTLRFKATNSPPFPFEWVDAQAAIDDYAAVLLRVSRLYESRF